MAEKKALVVYAAAYDSVGTALADLDAIEQLHKDEMIGQYDAAVIDKEDGKPHVVKRMDRPHIRVIPEWFGGGTLPRQPGGAHRGWRANYRKSARYGTDRRRQGREALGGRHHRRTYKRAEGSAQRLTGQPVLATGAGTEGRSPED
jgi:hypothetical protein